MLSRLDTMPPSGSTSWSYLLSTREAAAPLGHPEWLQSPSGVLVTSDLHGLYERLRKTILSAGVWPCSLEHGKRCLSAYDSIHELLAKGVFFSIGLLGSSFTGLSAEEFTISQSSFWRLCTRGPATLRNIHPLHPFSVCYKTEKTTQDWYLGWGGGWFQASCPDIFFIQKPCFKLLITTSIQEELPEFLDWNV